MTKRALNLLAAIALIPSAALATITVHTTDFIPNDTRTNFNGFEAISPLTVDTYTGGSYTENGITVENPIGGGSLNANIATTCIGAGRCFDPPIPGLVDSVSPARRISCLPFEFMALQRFSRTH